ncbi:glycosyltransferase family A protein [Clostridium oceanicum]|uniref:Glycosyltransferase family A protein n=1 Tax=Clostridium oceanicum TaxID=1543 RepID=A0ABP3V1V1_9CLOT
MKLEVLVSTMNQKDMFLSKKMNIKTDALIINQCDKEDVQELIIDNKKIRMLSYNERGLSKSRNRAIYNSKADICIIADDDLVYKDNYKNIIIEAYNKYLDADIIAFDVKSTNCCRPTSSLKEGNVDFLHSMKIASFQITFKRESILNKNIKFNELFGAGSKYTCGEENILLIECIKKGLKVKFVKKAIAIVNHNESTWYNGFDKKLFKTKGAMFYEMSSIMSPILISQFAIRKWNLYKNQMHFISAYKYMIKGIIEYKKIKSKLVNE